LIENTSLGASAKNLLPEPNFIHNGVSSFKRSQVAERFLPREGNVNALLADVLNMSHDDYAERFRGSAMKRAKLSGLQRNAEALLEKSRAGASPPS